MRKRIFFILAAVFLVGANVYAGSFTDNGNDTVTDRNTGLTWQKTEGGSMAWEAAISYCESLSLGGKDDWRLPNVKELRSIVDNTKYSSAIDATYFPNTASSYYWSSTTGADTTSGAWLVDFYYGSVYGYGSKPNSNYARCVRGGQ